MLQKARSTNSKSFLRELEFALVLIQDDSIRNYFLKKMAEVFAKRKDPDQLFTGEKALKKELLAYFNQLGNVKTANVWCRNIDIDVKSIQDLMRLFTKRLLEANVFGILEIHLQDREINSPHIQFVGTNAELAEIIIAQTLVELRYETSVESAIGKREDFIPQYFIDQGARTADLQDTIDYNEQRKEREFYINVEKLDRQMEKFKDLLNRINSQSQNLKNILSRSSVDFEKDIQERRDKLKQIRRRMSRRK